MLLLFAPELVVVGILLVGVLVLVLVLLPGVFFFKAGDPNKVVLGDLGVSFLRLLVGVLVPFGDNGDAGSSGFVVAVVELLFPSRRTRRAGGGVAVAELPVELVLLPSFGARCERVLPLVPVAVFRLSLLFLLDEEEEAEDSSLDS